MIEPTQKKLGEPAFLHPYENKFSRSDNLHLRFNRFIPYDMRKAADGKVNKQLLLQRIAGPLPVNVCQSVQERQKALIEDLASAGHTAVSFCAQTAERLAIGLGNAHPAENGLLLHHIHGLPYLSGAGLKGVARSWVVSEHLCPPDMDEKILGTLDKLIDAGGIEKLLDDRNIPLLQTAAGLPEHDTPKDTLFAYLCDEASEVLRTARKIFGRQGTRGEVVFFDAFPIEGRIDRDVMTPHYQSYYGSGGAPRDTGNPVPIPFATVAAGTLFKMHLASVDPNNLAIVSGWLQDALSQLGAGAKTAVGFGHFEIPGDPASESATCASSAAPEYNGGADQEKAKKGRLKTASFADLAALKEKMAGGSKGPNNKNRRK